MPGGSSKTGKRRADRVGQQRTAFEKNKKRILATQEVCGICGQLVDKSLKKPHPLSPNVDHIIPIAQGGHPSDISNLQLTHYICNLKKGDRLQRRNPKAGETEEVGNYDLPQSRDWKSYKAVGGE